MRAAPLTLMHPKSDFLAAGLFVLWTACSLGRQVSSRIRRLVVKYDVFLLVPAWRFFWRDPQTRDYFLYFRDTLPDGTRTEWRPVLPPGRRPLSTFLWNPLMTVRKALQDQAYDLAQGYATRKWGGAARLADLSLRTYSVFTDATEAGEFRQYRITIRHPYRPDEVELVAESEPYPVTAGSGGSSSGRLS